VTIERIHRIRLPIMGKEGIIKQISIGHSRIAEYDYLAWP
jgi:hypothetical protein